MLRNTLLSSLLALSVAVCTAQTATAPAEMPAAKTLKLGTTWEWSRFDTRTKVEVAKSSTTIIDEGGKLQFFDGKNKYQTLHGGKTEKPFRAWPIELGKTWDFERGTKKQSVKVTAYESVEVPAGKFMAFKIVYQGYYTNSFGSHPINETYWYAPEISADIKYIVEERNHSTFETRELVRYQAGTP